MKCAVCGKPIDEKYYCEVTGKPGETAQLHSDCIFLFAGFVEKEQPILNL